VKCKTQLRQIHALFLDSSGTFSSNSGENVAVTHQHGFGVDPVD